MPKKLKKMIFLLFLTFHQCLIIASADNRSMDSSSFDIHKRVKDISIGNRIIGGEATHIDVYPFAISIQLRYTSRHHCGGTYIMHGFVLTAAHCLVRDQGYYWITESPWVFNVVAGTTSLSYSPTWQISCVEKIIPHPYFSRSTMSHDIGILKLTTPFRVTPYVTYAPIPSDPVEFIAEGDVMCTVIGWGKTSVTSLAPNGVLRHAKVPLIPTLECNSYFTHQLHIGQICAGHKEGGIDACQGDSGGPLICNRIQVGIVSWGYGCAAANSPGVYCRVDFYLDWINKTITNIMRNTSTSVKTNQLHIINLILIILAIYVHSFN